MSLKLLGLTVWIFCATGCASLTASPQAKGLILFLGDGMGLSTVTAARLFEGGAEHLLSFEKLPYTALINT